MDNDSQEFISWVLDTVCNPAKLAKLQYEIVSEFVEFLAVDFSEELKDKLIKGQEEHGPIDYAKDCDKELKQEFLDLIGWSLYRKWINERKRS